MTTTSIRVDGKERYDLGPIDRIPPGEGQTFLVNGREVAVFRTRGTGELFATQGRCPHRQGLLADGIAGDGKVICPLHSYRFDLATGTPLDNACAALRTYRTEVTGEGRVLLWLTSPEEWSAPA
jgi:nitrite reductase (NADH) small subunit